MTATMSRWALSLLILLGLAAGAFHPERVLAQASKPIQTQDTNVKDVVAELMECKRADGVLTVKLRFRNTSATEHKGITLVEGESARGNFYVTAGTKKYFALRDTEKKALGSPGDYRGAVDVGLDKGGSYVWWEKYPAPPADVKKVSYYTPVTPPFDDVPIN